MSPQIAPEAPLISPNAPGPNIPQSVLRREGAVGQAVAQFGSEAEATGLHLANKIKEQEAQSESLKAHADDLQWLEATQAQLKTSQVGGYITDGKGPDAQGNYNFQTDDEGQKLSVSQAFKDAANERYQSQQLSLGSDLAQQLYRQHSAPLLATQAVHMTQFELEQKAQASSLENARVMQEARDGLVDTPDINQLYRYARLGKVWNQQGVGRFLDQDTADKASKLNDGALSESLMRGGIDQVFGQLKTLPQALRADKVAYWLSVLNGTDQASRAQREVNPDAPIVSTMLDPDKKATFMHELLSMDKEAKAHDQSDWHEMLENALAKTRMNQPSPVTDNLVRQLGRDLVSKGAMSETHYQDALSQYSTAKAVGQTAFSPSFLNAPESDQAAAIERAKGGAMAGAATRGGAQVAAASGGAVSAERTAQALFAAAQASNGVRGKDYPQFLETYPVNKGYTQAASQIPFDKISEIGKYAPTLAAMDSDGLAAYKHAMGKDGDLSAWRDGLSVVNSQKIARQLTDPGVNAELTVSNVKSLMKAFGPNFAAKIDRMVSDGNLSAGWRMVGYMDPSTLSMTEVVKALKGGTATKSQFETIAKGDPTMSKDLETSLATQMGPVLQAYSRQNYGDFQRNLFPEALTDDVRSLAQSKVVGGMKPAVAVQVAVDTLINDHAYINTRNVGGNFLGMGARPAGIMLVPHSMGGVPINPIQNDQIVKNLSQPLDIEARNLAFSKTYMGFMGGPTPTATATPLNVASKPLAAAAEANPTAKAGFDKAYNERAINNGYWRISDDHKGFNRIAVDDRGFPSLVQQRMPDGKVAPYFVSLQDALLGKTTGAPLPAKTMTPQGLQ